MLDEFRSTSITWDKATRRIYSPITANASDSNGRKLNIQVVNSGKVENLTGTTLHLYWETKDKLHDGLDAFNASDISKGEFELFYTTGMLSNVGELNATLVLVDSTGKVVSDWFKITVTRGINEGAIESENSFSSLTQALIDISNLEQNYAPRLNDLTAQLQQTEQSLNAQLAENTQDLEQRGYNILWSALDVVDDDWTAVIQTALSNYGEVFVPNETELNVHGTIELLTNKSLRLGNNSALIKPTIADNDEPIIWVKSNYATLSGVSMLGSTIRSEKPSPLGVVCLGYKGIDDLVGKNVLYNTVQNVSIEGDKIGGEVSGLPSYSLYLCNNQVAGLASYFNTIQNVRLANANVGLMFEGYANANIINNVQFYQVGNEKQLNGGAIKFKESNSRYPLDNIITNVFHHKSNNAITINFEGRSQYNNITNIVSEQGGVDALYIKNDDDYVHGNIITGISNISGGSSFTPNFSKKNIIFMNNGIYAEKVRSKIMDIGRIMSTSNALFNVAVDSDSAEIARFYGATAGLLLSIDRDNTDPRSVLFEHSRGNSNMRFKVSGIGEHVFETNAGKYRFDDTPRIFLPGGTFHGEIEGSPEGVMGAPVGSTVVRTDGGPGTTFYVKESGTGKTGWVAK